MTAARDYFTEQTERRARIRRAMDKPTATLPDALQAIHDTQFTGQMIANFHQGVLQELRPLDSEEGLKIVRK